MYNALLVAESFLNEFHYYSLQHLPNEVSCLLTGGQWDGGWFVADFLHLHVARSDERSVAVMGNTILEKAGLWSPIGHVHTHPGKNTIVSPSPADYEFMNWFTASFQSHLKTFPFFMIYAPHLREVAFYQNKQTIPFRVTQEIPLKTVRRRRIVVDVKFNVSGKSYNIDVTKPLTSERISAALSAELARQGLELNNTDALPRKIQIVLRQYNAGQALDLGILQTSLKADGLPPNDVLLKRVRQLERDLEQSSIVKNDLEKKLVAARNTIERLEREKYLLSDRQAKSSNNTSEMQTALSRLQEDFENSQAELVEARKQIELLSSNNDELNEELNLLRNQPDASKLVQEKLAETSRQLDNAQLQIRQLEEDKKQLEKKLKARQRTSPDDL